MVQFLTRAFTIAFYLMACIVVASFTPALAQTEVPTAAKSKAIEVPQPILESMLNYAEGAAAIEQFSLGDGAPAELVAKRAAAVIRRLGSQRSVLEPEDLLEAVDRVVHVAARSLSYATVMRTAVAQDYRPDNAVLAWHFWSAWRGGNAASEFTRRVVSALINLVDNRDVLASADHDQWPSLQQ